MGECCSLRIVNLVWLDHNADLAACLDGKAALNAVEGFGDLFEALQALEIRLKTLAACARPCR